MECDYRIRIGVLTVSDRCSQGINEDKSGAVLQELIKTSPRFHGVVERYKVIPDEIVIIQTSLREWVSDCDVILTTGGTGLSQRDVTPEATKGVIEKECPGIVIALMEKSIKMTPMAPLSRLTAGTAGTTLIINFPGSSNAVKDCFAVVETFLKHAVQHLQERKNETENSHKEMQSPSTQAQNVLISKVNLHPAERPRNSEYPLLSVADALEVVFREANCERNAIERELMDSFGHVLGQDIHASAPHPPFPASIKDGYAVIAEDGAGMRKVVGSVVASAHEGLPGVKNGLCARISTGAPVPPGADAVVQVEDTELVSKNEEGDENMIRINVAPSKVGQDIRQIGSDIAKGEKVLGEGTIIESTEIGILASLGVKNVPVFEKPTVAVMSTGNEVANYGDEGLGYGRIRDSNRPTLMALFRSEGFPVFDGGIAVDEPSTLLQSLVRSMKQANVVVTSGGVSMGEKDLLKHVLETDLGFKVHFGRVFMKPGKPTCFASGRLNGKRKLVFALPGNPVSAWVTSHLYVLPTLRKLQNMQNYESTVIRVQVSTKLKLDPRPEYHRAVLVGSGNNHDLPLAVSTGANQMSSRLTSTRGANLLLKLPPKTHEKSFVDTGEIVDAIIVSTL